MGQRGILAEQPRSSGTHESQEVRLTVFPTELGWFGMAGRGTAIVRLFIGHGDADEVRDEGRRDACFEVSAEEDWNPDLRRRLQQYAAGLPVDFSDCEVLLPARTAFQQRVLAATRRLKYGETATYGELAAKVGVPGAARAVGSVMASNLTPIVIPCHRIVAAGGRLGGFTSPQGIDLKRRLLEMESA